MARSGTTAIKNARFIRSGSVFRRNVAEMTPSSEVIACFYSLAGQLFRNAMFRFSKAPSLAVALIS
jgi:hypothetical protein